MSRQPVVDMDTVTALLFTPNSGLELQKIARMSPEEFNAKGDSLVGGVDLVSGDLQVTPLPADVGGSSTWSYEHMNFLLFWFNIRRNVARRVSWWGSCSRRGGRV